MKWRIWVAPLLAAIGAMWCVGMGFWLWFTPMRYDGITVTEGTRQEVTTYRSFSEVSQLGPLPLIIPACVALVAVWAAWGGRRVGLGLATLLLAGFTIISGFSIGANYLPAVGALILATLITAALTSGTRESRVAVYKRLQSTARLSSCESSPERARRG